MLLPREDVLGPCAFAELDTAGAAAPPFATYLQPFIPSRFPHKTVFGIPLMRVNENRKSRAHWACMSWAQDLYAHPGPVTIWYETALGARLGPL